MEACNFGKYSQQHASLDQLARVLQNITEQEAQDLPEKDSDGMHSKLHGMASYDDKLLQIAHDDNGDKLLQKMSIVTKRAACRQVSKEK